VYQSWWRLGFVVLNRYFHRLVCISECSGSVYFITFSVYQRFFFLKVYKPRLVHGFVILLRCSIYYLPMSIILSLKLRIYYLPMSIILSLKLRIKCCWRTVQGLKCFKTYLRFPLSIYGRISGTKATLSAPITPGEYPRSSSLEQRTDPGNLSSQVLVGLWQVASVWGPVYSFIKTTEYHSRECYQSFRPKVTTYIFTYNSLYCVSHSTR
jgi:hypothetical protein